MTEEDIQRYVSDVGVPLTADDLATLSKRESEVKFNAEQPRVPAGNPGGGQWAAEDGLGSGDVRAALQTHLVDFKNERDLTGPGTRQITDLVPGSKRVGYLDVPHVAEMHEAFMGGQQPTLKTNPEDYAKRRTAYFRNEPLEEVPIEKLTFTQERVNEDRVAEMAKHSDWLDKPVSMVRVGDAYYVMDGHHRAVAASRAGRTTMHGNVMDLTGARRGYSQAGDETGSLTPGRGDQFTVFRAQTGDPKLEGRNAGNAAGLAMHLSRQDDFEAPSSSDRVATHIHAYRVSTSRDFGDYEYATTNRPATGAAVGRQQQRSHIVYSFPRSGGSWKAEPIGTVAVKDLRARLRDITGSESFDDAGTRLTTQIIRQLMRDRISGKKSVYVKFNPAQPRDPAGTPTGGQWTSGGVAGGLVYDGDPKTWSLADGDTMTRSMENGRWKEERASMHETALDKMTKDVPVSDEPYLHMMGGGAASGKSTMRNAEGSQVPQSGVVDVNADDIKTDHIPEFKAAAEAHNEAAAALTHEESSWIAARAVERGLRESKTVVLDAVGDSGIVKLEQKIKDFRSYGAKRIVADYVTIPTDLALERNETRYQRTKAEGMGRKVPETILSEGHRAVSEVFPKAIERGLFDEFRLWDSDKPKGVAPTLIISGGKGKESIIHDAAAWKRFLAKSTGGKTAKDGSSAEALTAELLNRILFSVDVYDTPEEAGLPSTDRVRDVWNDVKAEVAEMKAKGIIIMPLQDYGNGASGGFKAKPGPKPEPKPKNVVEVVSEILNHLTAGHVVERDTDGRLIGTRRRKVDE